MDNEEQVKEAVLEHLKIIRKDYSHLLNHKE